MKSLYRKYRPLRLEDVVGQGQVITPLTNSIKFGRISHAYLFTGPRGTGKTSVARIFAHEINDFEYKLEDDYTDIIEIDGASNRGIDDIREIREKAMIKPTSGKYKVYIIDEVHMLTKEAFNALLKTLEEPPEHVIFIMATTDLHKVPVTILSRAQVYNFKLADPKIILEHLKKICVEEKIDIEEAALTIVVKRGGGSFRDSLSLLDQISTLSNEKITHEMVENAMGLPEDIKIIELLENYASEDVVKITTLLKDLFNSGVRAEIIAGELISNIIEDPRQEYLPLLESLPDVKEPFSEARLMTALLLKNMPSAQVVKAQNFEPTKSEGKKFAPTPAKPKLPLQNPTPQKPPIQMAPNPKPNVPRNPNSPKPEASLSKFERFMLERAKMARRANSINLLAEKSPAKSENSNLNSKISAIMGGKVEEYGGGNPF